MSLTVSCAGGAIGGIIALLLAAGLLVLWSTHHVSSCLLLLRCTSNAQLLCIGMPNSGTCDLQGCTVLAGQAEQKKEAGG